MSWVLLQNSLLVACCTTILSVSFGFISALWLAGLPDRLRTGFLSATIVALAFPPFLVTNCWLHYLGQTGVWHQWLPLNIFSFGGTIWVLSLLLWPLSFLLVWGAWQRLEPAQFESDMAVTGGALVRALLFPLARSALAQAGVLTLVLALNNFTVPAILQVKVFPAEMWIRFNTSFDTWGALRISWPLVLGPLLLVFWFSRHEFPWPHLQAPVPADLFRRQLGAAWFWSSGACAVILCLCSTLLPLFQILSAPRTWTELPGALAAGQNAVWTSFWYAGLAATVTTMLSLLAVASIEGRRPKSETRKKTEIRNPKNALAAAEHRRAMVPNIFGPRVSGFVRPSAFGFRISRAAGWFAFLLPGVLLGIGLIHAFNHGWSAWFYQSSGIVILAFVIRYLVIGWYSATQAAQRVDQDLRDAAVIEGASRWQMLRYVQWPQIARSVLVAWYIVFLFCLWDVESMILVVPPGGETLALRVFNLLHYGHNTQVNALCFALLGVALVPLLLAKLWGTVRDAWCVMHKGANLEPQPRTTHHAPRTILLLAATLLLLPTACSPSANRAALHSQIFQSVQIIGSRGVGVGQLNKPRSLAVDAAHNVYVVDMTGRVQKFSPDGKFLLSWQMPQTDRGKPKGMGRDCDGNILVVEPHYSRVNVFSPMGSLIAQWGSHGTNEGQLSLPRAVAVNSHREIFVSEYQEAERVQKFIFDSGGPRAAAPAAVSALESSSSILHPSSLPPPSSFPPPRWEGSFGQAGTGPGEFNRPEGLCFDAQDRLYVADSCNHRIEVFSSDGKFLRAYGKPGTGPGELSYPYDICVDNLGRQYVCEFGNSRIQVFDAQDKPVEIIGGPGAEPGRFGNPWAVALDSAGNLYVADSQNHRVQKLLRRQ
jgi:ABC-type Fe3+ transport system permease subunit/sugar lactone lactonase YvrE